MYQTLSKAGKKKIPVLRGHRKKSNKIYDMSGRISIMGKNEAVREKQGVLRFRKEISV